MGLRRAESWPNLPPRLSSLVGNGSNKERQHVHGFCILRTQYSSFVSLMFYLSRYALAFKLKLVVRDLDVLPEEIVDALIFAAFMETPSRASIQAACVTYVF